MKSSIRTQITKLLFRAIIVALFAFLLLPILVVVVTSFTAESFPTIPYDGISFTWYGEFLSDQDLLHALMVSSIVATLAAFLATIVGTIAAIGFVRAEFRYKQEISTIMLLPMIISPVITGIALVRYFDTIRVSSGYPALVLGHTVLTLPFVFLLVRSELITFDQDLERASRVLGADPVTTFRYVTGPIIAPALLAGGFIAFVVSFGEFTATQFLISPDTTTVPVIIYTMLRTGLTPTINVLSVVLIIVMLVLALLSRKLSS